MASSPVFLSNMKDAVLALVNGTGTTATILVTPGASGSRVKSLQFTSDDTVSRTFQLIKTKSAVDYVLGEIVVPAGAGTDGTTPGVNGLNATNMPGMQSDGLLRFIDVPSGTTLKIKPKVAITAAKTVNVVAEYGDV